MTTQEKLIKRKQSLLDEYNFKRTHQGKRCHGRTPIETFLDGKKYFGEKNLSETLAA